MTKEDIDEIVDAFRTTLLLGIGLENRKDTPTEAAFRTFTIEFEHRNISRGEGYPWMFKEGVRQFRVRLQEQIGRHDYHQWSRTLDFIEKELLA